MMADFNFYQDDDIDEKEDYSVVEVQGTDSAVIAIQMTENLFDLVDDTSNFQKIITAVKDMIRNKVISSENELQGVILFGTEKEKNTTNFKNVYILLDIDVPSAKRIEDLSNIAQLGKMEFKCLYGFSDKYKVSDVLWTASSLFSSTRKKLRRKNLILIASDDEPHKGDKNLILRAKTKAKDAMDQGIEVQVVSFNQDFDISKFYKDIISFEDSSDDTNVTNPIENIENLYESLLKKCSKQRTIAKINFELAEGVTLPVGIYTSIRQATKGTPVNIHEQSNLEASMKTNIVESDTGAILLPSDIKLFQTWGGRQIVFESSEVQDMRRISDVNIKLLCFKDVDLALKMSYHVKPAQYLTVANYSKDAYGMFKLLHKKCREKNLVAICSYAPRSNSTVAPVALLPSEPAEDVAPGFHVIYLPTSDDIRKLDIKMENEPANEEQVQAAENLIRKLKFTYTPQNFDNPALQKHYRYLEALALDSDAPENIVDHTLPDLERIEAKAGTQIEHFKSLVFTEQNLKRKLNDGDNKKAKVAKTSGNIPNIDVEEYVKEGKLNKLTVPTLKTICQMKGLSITGKKADLVDRIQNSY